MREYREIDLNLEPCIFPDCGHFLTVTSMDGQMSISDHYTLDANGLPAGIHKVSEPFSMDHSEPIRVCPTCRGSLRNIARYGRIVRRGMLDEATKKFITWSNGKYLKLAEALVAEQEKLANAKLPDGAVTCLLPTGRPPNSRVGHFEHLRKLFQPVAGKAGGSTSMTTIEKAQKTRYLSTIRLWDRISTFGREVRKEEQPFQRVADLVKHANRIRHQRQQGNLATIPIDTPGGKSGTHSLVNHKGRLLTSPSTGEYEHHNDETKEFRYDESVIQVKGQLLVRTLLLKCEIMVFDDLVRLVSANKITMSGSMDEGSEIATAQRPSWSGILNVEVYLKECNKLITLAEDSRHPKEQAHGHLFAALFCGFARALERDKAEHGDSTAQGGFSTPGGAKSGHDLKQAGLKHISLARAITEKYPSTLSPPSTLEAELDSATRFLNEGTFYQAVTSEELRAVYKAMSSEFLGTGHWYTCLNNHPFTVGECGMPMEQARCPECGAPVGGLSHQPAMGVRRADRIEEMARGVNGLRI